jgi:hypothetical protein
MGSFKPPCWDALQPDELERLESAFEATWASIKAFDPFRDFEADDELKKTVGEKLCALAAIGITDAEQLQAMTLASLQSIRSYSSPSAE